MNAADVQAALLRLAQIKAQMDELAEQKADAEERLVKALQSKGQKTVTIKVDSGDEVRGTLCQAQRVVYDEFRLKKALGAKVWDKVTRKVLDKEKLEAAITVGQVDPNVVAGCTEIKDSKPYIKVSGTYSATSMLLPPIPPRKRVVKVKPIRTGR